MNLAADLVVYQFEQLKCDSLPSAPETRAREILDGNDVSSNLLSFDLAPHGDQLSARPNQ